MKKHLLAIFLLGGLLDQALAVVVTPAMIKERIIESKLWAFNTVPESEAAVPGDVEAVDEVPQAVKPVAPKASDDVDFKKFRTAFKGLQGKWKAYNRAMRRKMQKARKDSMKKMQQSKEEGKKVDLLIKERRKKFQTFQRDVRKKIREATLPAKKMKLTVALHKKRTQMMQRIHRLNGKKRQAARRAMRQHKNRVAKVRKGIERKKNKIQQQMIELRSFMRFMNVIQRNQIKRVFDQQMKKMKRVEQMMK